MVNGLNRYKVVVSAGLPTSVKMVALRISMATGWEFRPNPFEKRDWDYMVYVSDPKIDSWLVGRSFPPNRVIMYLVSEGPVRTPLTKAVNKQIVVTPTEFVKKMFELKGVHVYGVIPHGVEVPEKVKPVTEKNGFYYRAYYLERKYPKYGLQALEEYVKRYGSQDFDIWLVGDPFTQDYFLQARFPFMKIKNPLTPDELRQLYDNHLFFLNLSDAEGFGLQPLEAMAYGEIVITPYYPAIREYLPVDCNIAVGVKRYWLEKLDYEYILHAEYSPEDYLKAMEIAREMALHDRETLAKWSECNRKVASKYDYRLVYQAFVELIEQIRR